MLIHAVELFRSGPENRMRTRTLLCLELALCVSVVLCVGLMHWGQYVKTVRMDGIDLRHRCCVFVSSVL